jgi:polyisoprenoid-binding protein YceI
MKSRLASFVAVLALTVGSALAADTYKLDPVHSMVIFKVNHMGVSNTYGRFNEPSGTFSIDPDPANMSFETSVAVEKIDTGFAARDHHLKSADFFDAMQFPTITFKSTGVKKSGSNTYEVTGDLTLHGVTKSITVTVNEIGAAKVPPKGEERAGFETTFTVKRSDYGMNFMPGMVGDEITLMVNTEGVKQ